MKELYELKTIEKDGHHLFTYKDGKKTPIPDDGVVFAYLAEETENGRMLKVTDFPDRAGSIDGKFVRTDELTNGWGKPRIGDKNYDIWGIGEDASGKYVITSVLGDKFYIEGGKNITVSHPNKADKKEAMKTLYSIYELLI